MRKIELLPATLAPSSPTSSPSLAWSATPSSARQLPQLRDKLTELERCGVQQVVVLPFDGRLASQSPDAFINDVLLRGLGVRYVLVGDDFRFGAKRAGDYAMLDAAGQALGFDGGRMTN